ncbi:MAG: bifunctional oligoribonuclease/PAP phosphatase NrnA [Oscillospiraceae bacterium]
MKISLKDTAAWLAAADRFLIITHRRPDGDTLCSASALARGLKKLGKTVWLYRNPEATEKYTSMMGNLFAPEGYDFEHIISVDTASAEQYPNGAEDMPEKTVLCIDHHISNTGYAERTCLVPEYAACGEIVYDILMALSDGIDAETAKYLYIAVSTDTGCFAYANTTANTLRCAASLIDAGAPNADLNKTFFRTKAKSRLILEGMLINGITFEFGGKVAFAIVTQKMIKDSGAAEEAMDDIAAIPGQIEGVLAGITIKELPDRQCRISVRTMPDLNANALCSYFDGGGHVLASGCGINATAPEAKERLIMAMREIWGL